MANVLEGQICKGVSHLASYMIENGLDMPYFNPQAHFPAKNYEEWLGAACCFPG